MAQDWGSLENNYNLERSNSAPQMPLSPVLGSGKSVQKLLKNRQRHKKGSKKLNFKIDEILNDKKCDKSQKDDSMTIDFQPLNDALTPSPNQPEDLSTRIKRLEASERKKTDLVDSISCKIKVEPTMKLPEPKVAKRPQEPEEFVRSTIRIDFKPLKTPNFRTGAGVNINISDLHIEKSKILFDDILNPSCSNKNSRENKFNYLHKQIRQSGDSIKCASEETINYPNVFQTNVKHKSDSILETGVYKLPNPKHFVKNIIEGKASECLSGFKSLSDNNHKPDLKTNSTTTALNCNVFDGETSDDLYVKEISGVSKTDLAKEMMDSCFFNQKFKNIFVGESFNNLNIDKLPVFSNALVALNKSDKMEGFTNMRKEQKLEDTTEQIFKQNAVNVEKTFKNIFEGESFEDLDIDKLPGFSNASVALNKSVKMEDFTNMQKQQKLEDTTEQILKRNAGNVEKTFKNMFERENFEDLDIDKIPGFSNALVALNKSDKMEGFTNMQKQQNLEDTTEQIFKQNAVNVEKTFKNIFEGETFEDLNIDKLPGFSTASVALNKRPSDKIKSFSPKQNMEHVTEVSTSEAVKPITPKQRVSNENVFENENFENVNVQNLPVFSAASLALSKDISNNTEFKLKKIKSHFGLPNKPQNSSTSKGFRNIFEGENFDDLNLNFGQSQCISKKNVSVVPRNGVVNTKGFRNIFEGENFDDINLALGPKFSKFTPSKINSLSLKNSTFQTPIKTPTEDTLNGFSKEEQESALNISNDSLEISEIIQNRFNNICSNHTISPLISLKDITDLSRSIQNTQQKMSLYSFNSRKRKFSFEANSELNTPLQSRSSKQVKRRRLGCHVSPTIQVSDSGLKRAKLIFEDLRPKPTMETSTPVKLTCLARPLICDLTPIQKIVNNDRTLISSGNRFSLTKPSVGNVQVWLDNLTYEKRQLQEQLSIVNEKQTILNNQKTILEFAGKSKKKIVAGVLFRSKCGKYKISLRDLVDGESSINNNPFLDQINSQNAHLVHFYVCDKRTSHIRTEDGAVIVSNTESRIGLSELEHSFSLLDGVDPNLIPKGWVRNHYKWIIWKLASYERMFPNKLEGCLSVENVVQQMKFRYDIEIDRARRPILRKIFEKDDCSQRRMILCVSKIVKQNNLYELELTDGWYSIRTLIDRALSNQITNGKIKLGVKLMVYGAELVNCEGCHPLEAPDGLYIKINLNCTRRVKWWCKMGAQRESGPFVVPLNSVNMEGGKVGCIKCFVARVYPVKYMEKIGETNVWRNQKAEERRQQDFLQKKPTGYNHDIKNITDPATLYNLVQKSFDPEEFDEILSDAQKTILCNYTTYMQSGSFSSCYRNKSVQERMVTALLKIKLVDASCDSDKIYEFDIWKPGEGHLQEIKEGEIISIFNVSCSPKWGLSSGSSTQIRMEPKINHKFEKFKRKVTYIKNLSYYSKQNNIINEFDLVGLVVHKKIGLTQHVWFADSEKRLLLVIINDSPKNILALDTVNEGQIVSVCNVIVKHCFGTHWQAVGDHSVIFARYSQYKHLQDALEKMEEDFETIDRAIFLRDCQLKIASIEAKNRSSYSQVDLDGMECSQITMTDIALLECVDKLT